jgi:hypothetical protein
MWNNTKLAALALWARGERNVPHGRPLGILGSLRRQDCIQFATRLSHKPDTISRSVTFGSTASMPVLKKLYGHRQETKAMVLAIVT